MRKEGSYTKWTPEMDAQLAELYPTNTSQSVAETMGLRIGQVNCRANVLGLKKDPAYLLQIKQKTNMQLHLKGLAYRFPKGNISHNKGQKMSTELRAKVQHTFFKKGQLPFNTKPLGYERVNAEDYIEVKVREHKPCFEGKHRVIWKQYHGEVPAGHAIIFADGDRRNFNIENLVCVDRKDLAVRNRFRKKYGPEIAESILLLSQIKRKLKEI